MERRASSSSKEKRATRREREEEEKRRKERRGTSRFSRPSRVPQSHSRAHQMIPITLAGFVPVKSKQNDSSLTHNSSRSALN